jgi:toxin-antitoxin system PIN domain toxin
VKIVDVNVLLLAVNDRAVDHVRLRDWWTAALSAPEPVGLSWIVVVGFLRIVTNAKFFRSALPLDQALQLMSSWIQHPNVRLVQETPDHWPIFSALLGQVGTGGNLTTDVHLAALAIARGATLVSCDADFSRFARLKWENPLAVA